jgi:ABC-2 type transport system permease protein
MRQVVVIAGVELRRFLRDRSNIFFVFIFPLLLVLVLGSQFSGGSEGRLAVAGPDGDLKDRVVTALEDDGVVVTEGSRDAVREQVARGRADAGLVVTDAAAARFSEGAAIDLQVIPGAQQGSVVVVQRLRTVAEELRSEQARREVLLEAGVPADEAARALGRAEAAVRPATMRVQDTGELAQEFRGLGRFDLQAVGETLLFVFLISLAGSATLIQGRRLGVVRRTLAAPVSTLQAVGGQALGRFAIAGFQGGYIMLATALLFDVDWGTLWLSLLILAVFSAVAAGAAMVLGSLIDNEGTASGVGVGVGLVTAALGGCMLPLELFPDTLRTVAHVTPHAWAYEAFADVQRHGAGLLDVLPQLGVLTAMAAALLTVGAWTLRRSLSRAL